MSLGSTLKACRFLTCPSSPLVVSSIVICSTPIVTGQMANSIALVAFWSTLTIMVIVEFGAQRFRPSVRSSCPSAQLQILLGLKRLHGFLEVTTAQVHNGNYAKWFGINKWYQSFALRNFDLEDMEFESTNSGTTAKLPILKLGEYEMWVIRIKQYFQIQDYALWEVIENGDSWVSVPQTTQENGTSVTKMSIPVTAEEKTNKKNDVKARGLLLMALPNEYQLV
ncbi:hypothetical protein Tco_1089869 [Tanacetum coccineum]|uniref:Uncharacterized protein n=1 Tax=Tanacetum coccineum TaxID=301880 RepID=A0ABQ5I2J8_9ASTR